MFAEFLVGLFVLLKGSDFFVDSASRIAKRLGVSEFVIGLTFVSIGTSLPELVTSSVASYTGNPGLAVGNLVGSNIANIGLILGLSALLATLKIEKKVFYRDGLIMLAVSFLLWVLSLNKVISRMEGLFLLVVYAFYLEFLFKVFYKFRKQFRIRNYVETVLGLRKLFDLKFLRVDAGERLLKKTYQNLQSEMLKDSVLAFIGIGAVFIGARYVVSSASEISLFLGVPQNVIGLIMIAIGTSLPELMVSISAARKGFTNLLVGNIIGSNIANITLIMGISAFIKPLPLIDLSVYRTIPAMIVFALLALVFMKNDWKLKRHEGAVLLGLYLLFLAWLMA